MRENNEKKRPCKLLGGNKLVELALIQMQFLSQTSNNFVPVTP